MGGKVFASHSTSITTPRIPSVVYEQVLDSTKKRLRKYFTHVGSAIEGPGKLDFGDVDVLVACPRDETVDKRFTTDKDVAIKIKDVLGAKAEIRNGPIVSVALPWPGKEIEDCIQVDVHLCLNE